MRRILLTSTGFENKKIGNVFLELAGKEPNQVKILFVPTAAINAIAILMLSRRMNSLLDIGILAENITVYDLHDDLTYDELCKYDAIFFSGGDAKYLFRRINERQFNETLNQYINNEGIYIGVSAGSIIATMPTKLPDSLRYVNCTLGVHKSEGAKAGPIDISHCPHIDLTDEQAVLLLDSECRIIE